jgi:hypothetical protein
MHFSEQQSLLLTVAAFRSYGFHMFSPSLSRLCHWIARRKDPKLPGYCGHMERVGQLRMIGREMIRLHELGVKSQTIGVGPDSMHSCAQVLRMGALYLQICAPLSNGARTCRTLANAILLESTASLTKSR